MLESMNLSKNYLHARETFFAIERGVNKLNHPPSDNLYNIVTRERGKGRAKCCPNIICHR